MLARAETSRARNADADTADTLAAVGTVAAPAATMEVAAIGRRAASLLAETISVVVTTRPSPSPDWSAAAVTMTHLCRGYASIVSLARYGITFGW